jgi:hypothetical protein
MNEMKGGARSGRPESTSASAALRLARSIFPRLGASVAANAKPPVVSEAFELMRAESGGTVLGHAAANGSRSPPAPADVVQLIDQARIFFETNREFARRCLRDALDLLGTESHDSTAAAAPFQCAVRPGGLAGGQAKGAHLDRHFRGVVSISSGMLRRVPASAPTRVADACSRSATIREGISRSAERWARHLAKISSSMHSPPT